MNTTRAVLLGAVSSLLAGCGGDDQLDTPENVRIWMTTASALAVYVNGSEELSIADGHATFPDPACPVTSDDGDVLTITGGCTNTEGRTFSGSATVERSGEDLTLTFSSYGSAAEEQELVRRRGTMTRRRVSDGFWSFDANLVVDGGMRTTLSYRGSVSGDYDARTTWSGHGRVSRDGVLPPTGTITATTENEVVDDAVCSGQPVSGRTMIETEDQNAVVFYDGDRDCDSGQRARYRVDGEERGTLGGVACSVAQPGRGAGSPRALLFGLGVLLASGARRGPRARRRG